MVEQDRHQLKISKALVKPLEQIALDTGTTRGGKPSIAGLITKIAKGEVCILDLKQVEMLRVYANEIGLSSVGDLISSIGRRDLLLSLPQSLPAQRDLVQAYIEHRQPFELAYATPSGELDRFPLLYAQIMYRNADWVSSPQGHWYLDCYCIAANSKTEIPELANNRIFRLDKLTQAVATPNQGEWRSEGLATIEVELELLGNLAHNYEPQLGRDVGDRWVDGNTRRVLWKVSSYFWAKRTIFRYGADCRVVSPDSFVHAIELEIMQMSQYYSTVKQ